MNSNLAMTEKLKSYESIMNAELEKLLQNMFKELNICTSDLNDLVNNCLDLYAGRQVDVTSLLGHKLQLGSKPLYIFTSSLSSLTISIMIYILDVYLHLC